MRFIAKTAAVAAALGLMAVPAAASGPSGHQPETTPPGYSATDNPGSEHRASKGEARAIGRDQCGEFKQNFSENRSQFGKCVSAVAKTLRRDMSPREACQGLSRKPADSETRSDFSACVKAAARAKKEARAPSEE